MTAATPVRRSGATWAALVLVTLLAGAATASAVVSLLVATGVRDVDRERAVAERIGDVGFGYDEGALRTAEAFAAAVTAPVAVVLVVVAVGLWTWRQWAREAAFGVLGLGGLLVTVLSVQGLTQDPPGRNAPAGLVAGLLLLGTVGLLLSPPSRDDFERRALQRTLREREAAAAARRARSS